MPASVSKMTSTTFVMRLALTERSVIDVTLRGTGFTYDSRTGAILGGEVQDIVLTAQEKPGLFWNVTEVRQLNGVNATAETLAEMFGTRFWNEARLMVDGFDKIAELHDGIADSYFSKTRNVTNTTEYSDVITGYKYADNIDGGAGDDELHGDAGNDRLYGGRGDDALFGDTGADLLFDRSGDNDLDGGAGNDVLRSGNGVDHLTGGSGRDILYSGGGRDWVSGGTSADSFVFSSKDSGKATFADFTEEDVLVNLSAGSAEEAYRMFMEGAVQDGRNVIVHQDTMVLVLKNTRLSSIDADDFADAGTVTGALLL